MTMLADIIVRDGEVIKHRYSPSGAKVDLEFEK